MVLGTIAIKKYENHHKLHCSCKLPSQFDPKCCSECKSFPPSTPTDGWTLHFSPLDFVADCEYFFDKTNRGKSNHSTKLYHTWPFSWTNAKPIKLGHYLHSL